MLVPPWLDHAAEAGCLRYIVPREARKILLARSRSRDLDFFGGLGGLRGFFRFHFGCLDGFFCGCLLFRARHDFYGARCNLRCGSGIARAKSWHTVGDCRGCANAYNAVERGRRLSAETNAAVRRGSPTWHDADVHAYARASETHPEGHVRPFESPAIGYRHCARIGVGVDEFTLRVEKFSVEIRRVLRFFLEDFKISRRCRVRGSPRGYGKVHGDFVVYKEESALFVDGNFDTRIFRRGLLDQLLVAIGVFAPAFLLAKCTVSRSRVFRCLGGNRSGRFDFFAFARELAAREGNGHYDSKFPHRKSRGRLSVIPRLFAIGKFLFFSTLRRSTVLPLH